MRRSRPVHRGCSPGELRQPQFLLTAAFAGVLWARTRTSHPTVPQAEPQPPRTPPIPAPARPVTPGTGALRAAGRLRGSSGSPRGPLQEPPLDREGMGEAGGVTGGRRGRAQGPRGAPGNGLRPPRRGPGPGERAGATVEERGQRGARAALPWGAGGHGVQAAMGQG